MTQPKVGDPLDPKKFQTQLAKWLDRGWEVTSCDLDSSMHWAFQCNLCGKTFLPQTKFVRVMFSSSSSGSLYRSRILLCPKNPDACLFRAAVKVEDQP